MNRHHLRTTCALFLFTFTIGSVAAAQNRFATTVVSYTQGTGGGIFVPSNALGGPQGAGLSNGSLDVCTLGVGGQLTLGFAVTIANGPGADLTVFENPFVYAGEVFSEVAYVEVSTDGVQFARFPSHYSGPSTGFTGFTAPWGTYSGLTGCIPVLANVATNTIDPLDPVLSGGEAFDLSALIGDPLVTSGAVNLNAIHFVRLLDVPHASGLDSYGNVIWDNSGPTGTADIDAVAVINDTSTMTSTQPAVSLYFDGLGYLNLDISDPNGFADIDQSTLHVSFDLAPVSVTRLRGLLPVVNTTSTSLHMRSAVQFPGSGRRGVLSVSTRDFSGQFSAAQIVLQG